MKGLRSIALVGVTLGLLVGTAFAFTRTGPCTQTAYGSSFITVTITDSAGTQHRAAIFVYCPGPPASNHRAGGRSNSGNLKVSLCNPGCEDGVVRVYVDGNQEDLNGASEGNEMALSSVPAC